jgi:glycosyltransferase involved in cell wall biosynthesis
MLYVDQRWIGNHGIGRFAQRVLAGLDYLPLPLDGHPAAPLDILRLTRAVRCLARSDLFFSPGYNSPLHCAAPFVFTIHDMGHVYCPENSSPLIRLYYATILKRSCHRAATILTVSEFTRTQIIEWSGVVPEKVINVGCGVDPHYCPDGNKYDFPFPYLLCVSNRKRHKNEFRIVEAFAKSGIAKKMHLVFTGLPTKKLTKLIAHCGIGVTECVRFTGLIPEAKLPSLYRGATALVFPSLYEGFALPVLEAMACGTPVVTSNVTAMPETAAGAALLVDPTSVQQIANATDRIACEATLRHDLRAKGLARAAQFSWNSTMHKVRAALASVEAGIIGKNKSSATKGSDAFTDAVA